MRDELEGAGAEDEPAWRRRGACDPLIATGAEGVGRGVAKQPHVSIAEGADVVGDPPACPRFKRVIDVGWYEARREALWREAGKHL